MFKYHHFYSKKKYHFLPLMGFGVIKPSVYVLLDLKSRSYMGSMLPFFFMRSLLLRLIVGVKVTPFISCIYYFYNLYNCLSFLRSCQLVIEAKNYSLVLCFSKSFRPFIRGLSFSSTSFITLFVLYLSMFRGFGLTLTTTSLF